MNFSWKRFLSMVLAIVMIIGMVPANATHVHAEEVIDEHETHEHATDEAVAQVQALIDALPGAEAFDSSLFETEEDYVEALDALEAQLNAIDEAAKDFTDEQVGQLDETKYSDAWAIINNYYISKMAMPIAVSGSGTQADPYVYEDLNGTTLTEGSMYGYWNNDFSAPDNGSAYKGFQYNKYKNSWNMDAWYHAESATDTDDVTYTSGVTFEVTKSVKTSSGSWPLFIPSYEYQHVGYAKIYTYYNPTVTVSGKDGVSASGVTTKVYHGGEVTFTLPAMDEDNWTATVEGLSGTVGLSKDNPTTVTVSNITSADAAAITVVLNKATIYNVGLSYNAEYGTASVDKTSGINGDTVTVTVNPNGANGPYSYYLVDIKVNGTAISGNTFTINGADANVVVTFGRSELEVNSNPILEINGYHTTTDYSARFKDIKANILSAVLKNGYTNIEDYNLHIWIDPIAGDARYFDYDDDSMFGDYNLLTVTNPYRFPCADFGDTVFECNLKVKIIDKEGRTVEATIAVTEEREAAQVSFSSAVSGKYDTLELFKEAVAGTINVLDNNNTDCKANAGLTVTLTPVEGKVNTYTVSYSLANDGATWLTTSGTLPGEVVWNISVYKVTFVDEDGTVLSEAEYPYSTEASNIELPANPTKADKVDNKGNVMATYTFNGWTVANVTGTATYTATYTEVAKTYTVTFKDYDDSVIGEPQSVEYGSAASAPTATQEYKTNDKVYTFKGWDVAFDNITGDLTVTAQYDEATRYYTVTFVNEDGAELQKITNLEYEDLPEYTEDTPTKAADNTYTYTFKSWDKEIVKVTEDNVVYKATYNPTYIDYTITWVYNGKTEEKTYHYGDAIVVPEASTYVDGNTTYTYVGWDADGDGDSEVGETLPATVTENITYKAIYTELTTWDVTVVYGNDTANTEGKVVDGETYTVPTAPTREGYRFITWKANGKAVNIGDVLTIEENTTITAEWAELFTITWMNDGKAYVTETDKYIAGETPVAPADPTKAADAQYTYTFAGWDKEISAVTGDVTYTATYTETVNVYDITFNDENGNVLYTHEDVPYGETPVYSGETPVKEYYSWAWDKEIASVTGTATYKLVWTPNTDANNNGVADELETAEITVEVTGNGKGTVTLTAAESATLTKISDTSYTLLFNSNVAATKVVTVTATPTDTVNTDGYVDYVITNPGTVTVDDGANEIEVEFGAYTLNANNGSFTMNGYYEARGNTDEIIKTLKADVLNAAGLDGANASNYTVTMKYSLGTLDLDKLSGWTNALNATAFFTAIELPESARQFTITDSNTGVSKTVTMKIEDSRSSAGLEDKEFTDVKVFDGEQGLNDYVNSLLTDKGLNPNGVTVSVELTEGSWPPSAAGVTTKLVYTVTYADSADYIGDSAKLTVNVQSSYNNCTVVADSTLTAGGSLTVSPSNDNKTVAGNDTITITVTPSGSNVVETITVTNKTTGETVTVSAISYNNKAATVTFKSGGATAADEYVVSVTYSQNYLNLKADQTIVYCLENDDLTGDELKELVFNAVYGESSAPMAWDNTTVEFAYAGIGGINLWGGVDSAMSLWGTHNFGEKGSETIRLTYKDEKYGQLQATVVLNVFDSCYSVEVNVETVTNGSDASIKDTYSKDSRAYLGVNYFKQGEELTVTLTPDGNILNAIWNSISGTYADSMPYIKSVTVYKNEVAMDVEVVRGQGEFSLGNLGGGQTYNAAVTFTTEADADYKIVVEFDVLKLEKENSSVQMPMYQGGNGYEAKVPSAQDIVNAILGKEYADNFLATYGGSFTVEYGTGVTGAITWAAVTDEALLAMNDGTKLNVRITWKETGAARAQAYTYYPVAVTAEVTLVDLRTPTSVAGSVPTEKVEYVEQDQLIAELKEAMGLAINANGSAIDVNYTVTYTITGDETNGYFAAVTVTYGGSADYKPTSKTFENVPVADIPDNATIKVTIQNASDVVTNNDGKIQSLDPATGIYTVIGNGTYNFKFTPVSGKAIESVTVNGVEVELTYAKQVATFSMVLTEKEHYEIVVETVNSVFELEDERIYDFAYGVMDPVNKDIVDAAIKYPTDIDYSNVKLEYLAREEGTVPVALPDIDLGFVTIPLGSFDIDLGELWLDPNAEVTEYDLEKLLDELVTEVIDKVSHGQLAATEAISYITEKLQGLTIGAHKFGAAGDGSTENIRISYEDDKYLLAQVVTDVTIHDYRIATEIVANDCTVTYGYSLADLISASGAYISADGAAVSGLKIDTNDLYLHANETDAQQITLYFAGDETYQPYKITLNVTVNKAEANIDYDSQFLTYGDAYDFALSVSPTVLPDGTVADIDRVEFMIGLDMHTLLDVDIEDKTVGLDQAIGYIQIRLPKTIRELPLVGQYLQGEFTLGQFIELINSLSDELGIDESSMEILNQVLEAITGVTDNMDIKVIIKDEDFHPTNIGVYIAGAVTVDADFETAYTADYLIIAPKTIEAELEWDYTDSNNVMTLPAYQQVFKDLMGAHVVETETMTGDVLTAANDHIKYLILGINDGTSEFLTTDIYGNIKANIWVSNDAINDNGAYVQIAYMLNWSNEIYYAMPIVRSFLITPQTVTVELVGATGDPNNELLKEFNNEPQGFNVKITNAAGELIYSDHYQSEVNKLSEYVELTITYVGVQTNGQIYNETVAPTNAGAYTVAVTYVDKDAEGNILEVGADIGLLVIEPTESEIIVNDEIIKHEDKTATTYNIAELLNIEATSTVDGLTPDVTIITGSISTDGDFSENGWDAVAGVVNVDFPDWVDAFLAEHAPDVMNSGITVGTLKEKLTGRLDSYAAELAELGATEDVVNAFKNLVNTVTDTLAKLPEDIALTFADTDTLTAKNVGAYFVVGIVTDSDHYPSVDAGILAIVPDVDQVFLKWNYADANGIFTPELLQHFDLYAKAYDDAEYTVPYTDKPYEITYQFIGINANGDLVVTNNADDLSNGVYTELAYIEFEVAGEMVISDMIARPIVIVPNTVDVEIVDANDNGILYREFNNKPQDVEIEVSYDGTVVTPGKDDVAVTYIGVQTNGKTWNSTTAPTHAGAYLVTAAYVERDAKGNVIAAGADVATLVIAPTEATVIVDETIVTVAEGTEYNLGDIVHVDSEADNTYPDTTIISASVGTDGTFSESGWNAVQGNVNVDFPRWIDEIIAEHAPSVVDGINAAQFADLLTGKLPAISQKLAEQGIDATVIDTLNQAVTAVTAEIAKLPDNATLSFKDDVVVSNVGVYLVAAVVTDSDHLPAADIGYLVIVPNVTEVKLDWNYDDANGIWTSILLETEDLFATAYDRETGLIEDEAATAKITYQFIGVNSDGEPVIYTFGAGDDLSVLPNGVYTEVAYIELVIDGQIVISDMIARPVVLAATPAEVIFVDETGAENNDRIFTFDNTEKEMDVQITIAGEIVAPGEGDLVVTYTGVQTNGKTYNSTTAPTQAGAYIVTATYSDYDANGNLLAYGVAVGAMVIEPADSSIEVTGDTVTYDGNGYTADVIATGSGVTEPDYTLISGGAYVSGDIDEIGVDAFHGNVNIDFPAWLDEALAETEFATEGVDTAYLIDFITSYRDDLIALIPVDELVALEVMTEEEINGYIDQINAYIDELLSVLDKLPKDVALTFEDDVTYTEPGYYFYYGIVTDSDHYPASDTGLLVIEKMPITFDLVDTTVTWDGEGHMAAVNNPNNADYATLIINRENNTINIIIDEDAQYLINTLARILDVEFDGDVQMSTIIENYSGKELAAAIVELIGELEKLDLSEEILKALAAVKTELETLPEIGTVTVNGALPTEVGEYEFYGVSYSQYYNTNTTEAVLEIVPVQVEVILDDNTKVYGETDPELTYTVKYYDHLGNELEDAGIANVVVTRESGENVGEYDITAVATLPDNGRYVLVAQPETATFEITPAELTVVLANKTKNYGDADPEWTYGISGLVNGDTADVLNLVISREEGENVRVGGYTITTTAENDNYIINIVDAKLIIRPANVTVALEDTTKTYGDADPALTYTVEGLKNGDTAEDLNIVASRVEGEDVGTYAITATSVNTNYNITITDGTLTITPADVTVALEDKTKTYGDADPEWTYTVSGLKNGEAESVLNIVTSREEGEDVKDGGYAITATAVNTNYNINVTDGTLSIKPADVTVALEDTTKTYGDADPEWTYTVSGLKNGEGESVLNIVTSREEGEDVKDGGYAITATAANANYNINVTDGTLTITPADVTVALEDKTKTYGDADPEWTYTVSGLKNGDTAEALNIETSRKEGENVSTYAITADAANANYNITVIDGTLTIAPAQITVTIQDAEKYYGDDDPAFTYEITSGELFYGDELDISYTREEGKDVGEYAITATVIENPNYTITVVNEADLTIKSAAVSVYVNSNVVLAGTETPDVVHRVEYDGAVTDEELGLSITWDAKTINGKLVHGVYDYVIDYNESDNWNVEVIECDIGGQYGDGISTGLVVITGDYICWNTNTGKYYDDVTDALEEAIGTGATIQMLKDATDAVNNKDELVIIVYSGLTFDLNGYYVQTENMLSYGVVLDTATGATSEIADGDIHTGGIMISNDTTKAWTQLQTENGGYLPIYDTVTGSYKFYAFEMQSVDITEKTADACKFRFRIDFEENEAYGILARTENSCVSVVLKMEWPGITGFGITYTMSEATVKGWADAQYNKPSSEFKLTLKTSGLSKLPSGSIKAIPTVVTQSGVTDASSVLEYPYG